MNIQMVDLKREYDLLKLQLDQAVIRVMESAQFINGPDVHAFAREVEDFLGVKHAIPCASGTDALQLAMMALDIGPGDEVITTPFTFVATAETIALLKAKPVYVDVEPDTLTIDPKLIEPAISKKTRAIIPVHLYGQAADMDPILKIARKHKLFVIEDAAQAFGATYKKKKIGTLGDLACFSFFPSKNLGSYGDAGMVVTNDDNLAARVHMIANHGSQVRYLHEMIGINSRLDSLQAAVLRVKLPYLEQWNELRRKAAAFYSQHLAGLDLTLPLTASYGTHTFHQYTIRLKKRDQLREFLTHQVIPTAIHYPTPLHLQPAFQQLHGYRKNDFPEAEKAAREVLSLPMHPHLTTEEMQFVVSNIKAFFNTNT